MSSNPDAESTIKTAPIYTLLEGSMMVNAPVKDVWPHVLDYTSWQKYSVVKHISGEPGQEGEVIYLKKDAGVKSTPYYARTIKLEPLKRVIWKTFREGAEYFGIVEFRVDDVQDKTQFSWKLLYEHVVSYHTNGELADIRHQQQANFAAYIDTIFPKLKEVVEKW